MNIKIIQLNIKHLDACYEIDQKSFNGLWTKSQWEKELSDPKRICIGALEMEKKKLLGFCSAWIVLDELQVTSIAVDPFHRRKGLGRFILKDLIIRSKSLRIAKMFLEVKETNEPAKALYQGMGFKTKGRRLNFYKDGNNALVYIKELTSEAKKTI